MKALVALAALSIAAIACGNTPSDGTATPVVSTSPTPTPAAGISGSEILEALGGQITPGDRLDLSGYDITVESLAEEWAQLLSTGSATGICRLRAPGPLDNFIIVFVAGLDDSTPTAAEAAEPGDLEAARSLVTEGCRLQAGLTTPQ